MEWLPLFAMTTLTAILRSVRYDCMLDVYDAMACCEKQIVG